jgi:crossover junction endodeoxyribonuclease RusA
MADHVIVIDLPWPPKMLSPNSRASWRAKIRPKAEYKTACYWLAFAAGVKPNVIHGGPLDVQIEFIPPDRRPRDVDNMLSSCKAAIDGVAQAMGIDDKHWRITISKSDIIGGIVRMTVAL